MIAAFAGFGWFTARKLSIVSSLRPEVRWDRPGDRFLTVVRPVPITYFDDTKRTSITIKGVYDFSKSLALTAGYAYEKYEFSDEQYNGYRYTIPAATNQNSYLSGLYAAPQYKANIFYALVSYRF